MIIPSEECCPGLNVVKEPGTGPNSFENLLLYAKHNLDQTTQEVIQEFINTTQQQIAQNQPPNLEYNYILQKLPNSHRDRVQALIQDIPIMLLRQRYDLLRQVRTDTYRVPDLDELIDNYCLKDTWRVDPEIPNVVARVVVAQLSQWELICLLHDKMKVMTASLSSIEPSDEAEMSRVIAQLGRFIFFLRWVPYEWVEEVLLDILKQTRSTPIDNLRFCISVLRALFCRPCIQKKTIQGLCTELFIRFNDKIPMDLQALLRAILVSGGQDTWYFLEQIIQSKPQLYLNKFFLTIMAHIDKVATARYVYEHRTDILANITAKAYVDLLADIGEGSDQIAEEMINLWDKADKSLKIAILNVIQEFHCKETYRFLITAVPKEDNLQLKLIMLNTIVNVGKFKDVMEFANNISVQQPILYYHIVELCYHRLIEDPVMLTKLKKMSPLIFFEKARVRIYNLYRFVHDFRDILQCLLVIMKKFKESGLEEKFTISSSFTLCMESNTLEELRRREETGDNMAGELTHLLSQIQKMQYSYQNNLSLVDEITDILNSTSESKPGDREDIFGNQMKCYPKTQLLHKSDFLSLPENNREHGQEQQIAQLIEAADLSITAIQNCFLFREWFFRRAPFVLTEDMPELVEKIKHGEELPFDPNSFCNKQTQNDLRKTFKIFYECTKQGVYLTDVFLDYLWEYPPEQIPERVRKDLTHQRSLISRGERPYHPDNAFDRHLQFVTFAHTSRYGKESLERPSIVYLWLRFLEASTNLTSQHNNGNWPMLPQHQHVQSTIGPLMEEMYKQQIEESYVFLKLVNDLFDCFHKKDIRIRVIPNITYGLFCLAPVLSKILAKGIHVSLAGISSRYCDDMNINEFNLNTNAIYPIKPYLFSTASNYGTLNHDRILIVVDGTMEPLDRHDPHKIRIPKAHRGYLNHLVAVNYIRSKYGYNMHHPERDVASALRIPVRYIQNLMRTSNYKKLVNSLLLSFDKKELSRFHKNAGTGRTYYSFTQWNPDGLSAWLGSRGDVFHEIPCMKLDNLTYPTLLFVTMNGLFSKNKVPAFFDNNPEVEKSRILLGPKGVWLDTGWPHQDQGIVINFPEGENQ